MYDAIIIGAGPAGISASLYIRKGKSKNIDTVTLFGTKYTMTKPFYKDVLKNDFNINVIIPEINEQKTINDIIYNELCKGIIKEKSKEKLYKIIENCRLKGAQAVVLGCTELPNIIKENCVQGVEIIDTTKAHCLEIVNRIS